MKQLDFDVHGLTISKAEKRHSKEIFEILYEYMKKGLLLPRDEENIMLAINSFFIAEYYDKPIGCAALKPYDKGLFEIRSLAVRESEAGKGIASALISSCINFVKNRNATNRVFALTRRPNLFIRTGFIPVNKEMFPEKVWIDCLKCQKLDSCDESAVLFE